MTTETLVIVVVVIAIVACAIFMAFRWRTRRLKSKFGPEYDRLVQERGRTMAAERELEQRAKRVEHFKIRPLSRAECDQFALDWRATQERFVDNPRGAIAEADGLVNKAMKAQGYPVGGEFEERAADLSVDHPRVVEHYRVAHEIAARDGRDAASTEDLRLAMKHYRALFEDLMGRHVNEVTGVKR